MESSINTSSCISQAETPNPTREAEKRRRPRVREVSSRFMSPVVSSSSSGDLHLPSSSSSSSKCPLPNPKQPAIAAADPHHHPHHSRSQSVQRRHPSPSSDSQHHPPIADENALRSLDTPYSGRVAAAAVVKKRPPAKYSTKENGDPQFENVRSTNGKFPARPSMHARSRSDTPIASLDRGMTSRTISTSTPRSMMCASAANTDAAKLLQSSLLPAPKRSTAQETSDMDNGSVTSAADESVCSSSDSSSEVCSLTVCDSPPVHAVSCKIRPVSEFRSSMPEADLLPTMSTRRSAEGGSSDASDLCRVSASSPCYRSLNAALSSCQQSFSPTKSISRSSVFTKSFLSSAKMAAISLPPHPSSTKSGMEAGKKLKKASTHQEDNHMLRLLHNRYLQWRFVNAKADTAMEAQRVAAENSLFGHVARISELRDSVARKCIELQHLKKMENLSSILNSQIPYLDEWSTVEKDYSSSLSGAVKALHDASLRLPVIGNVRADIRQLNEALDSATTVLESISPYVEGSLPKAEEVENVISELAEVVSKERALIEECGDLLSKAQMLQVEECSLRGHLIQLKRSCFVQPKEV